MTTTRTFPLTAKNRIGLGIAVVLGIVDLLSLAGPSSDDPDGSNGPPMGVLIAGAVFGLITIVAAVYTWRTGNRLGSRIVAGSRALSILGALPAFFVPDVPAGIVALVASLVLVTVVAIALVLSRPEADAPA